VPTEEKLEKPTTLLNLYHTGRKAGTVMPRKNKKKWSYRLCVVLCAERKFTFKHRDSKETVSQNLSHGSLLVMKDETKLTGSTALTSHYTHYYS
jgi:alkylated DNA repair dioxygenase AlkB